MRKLVAIVVVATCAALLPALASAQTSTIAGTVKDPSGAVLPGVTVEASSPALIEKTRSAVTDGSGQFKIVELRPGTYTVTFTLPGFSTVKREGVELTSDFTATINAEMKVGAVEETITVSAETPVVDVQNITTRTIMTRDVLDSIPTGRNIQAVGIMIPGTTIALGGGGALSRDVGGSGSLQQSPLQYRGSADTVQTIEGLRLNNLCANGAYSGVYWNDGSFQEISYVTGADSAEMGQGGIRVNLVPKDGGNQFHGSFVGNYAPSSWVSDNCRSAGIGQPCNESNLVGDTTYFKNNYLTNVSNLTKNYDVNPGVGGPIFKDKAWFYATYRYWGVDKTVADSFFNASSSAFRYTPDFSRPGIDDGHIRSIAGRVTAQLSRKDKISYYHDDQNKVRGHWGIAANVPPEASAIQATPTSFVSVTKWTRTQTSRLLFDGGLGIYDQEYQENYQPSVLAPAVPLVTLFDQTTGKFANAWNSPADHFSKLFTEQFAASYVTGAHSFRFGGTLSQARWRLVQQYTGNVEPVNYNGLLPNGNLNPVSVTLRLPTDRRNSINADLGIFAQDKWTIRRATINAGLRYDYFRSSTLPETLPGSALNSTVTFSNCSDGINNLNQGCTGRVADWKDLNPRIGVAFDVFGDGRTSLKASVARYVNGIGLSGGSITDNANPETTIGTMDTRAWHDLDGNGSPFDAAGNLQFNELTPSPATPNFGKNIPTTTTVDPAVLNGWGVRAYNWEYAISGQHQLAPRVSVTAGWYRRKYGNQTLTVDQRYNSSSYDGPFCVNAPLDPNLPSGGGYPVCGLYDLKPALVNLPPSSLLTFSSNYGGETNIYQGYDVSLIARFNGGAFIQGGVNAAKREFDECNLVAAGIKSVVYDGTVGSIGNGTANAASELTEIYPDGSRACHQIYGYRPDVKALGAYPLPFDVMVSGTFQFTRGVQAGAAGGSAVLATWAAPNAIVQQSLGRPLAAGAQTKVISLIEPGSNYGNNDLKQLDLKLSKRFRVQAYSFRVDLDAYNVFNSDWPFVVSNVFSTSTTASTWLRPANVLQSRFFKIGALIEF